MNKTDEAFSSAQKAMRAITGSFGNFMHIHKVVAIYLWPFVFAFFATLILVGIDAWLN